MQLRECTIPGCYEITPFNFKDERGSFVKTFLQDFFVQNQLECDFAEEFYSLSYKNVLRGLHFQIPPADHVKIVYCPSGEVMDVVVDLRIGSPTYGKHEIFTVSSSAANIIYIPRGLAHGFYALSDQAIMCYKTSTAHSVEHDSGILWNSLGIPWPGSEPIISKRDSGFPRFQDFNSPFQYEG